MQSSEEELRRQEDRKKRMEEERRRKLDEQRRKREEEEQLRREELERQREEEQLQQDDDNTQLRQSVGDDVFFSKRIQKDELPVDDFDLLGGLTDDEQSVHSEESDAPAPSHRYHQQRERDAPRTFNNNEETAYVEHAHREKPQRGPIDEECDAELDGILTAVPVKKSGRIDGVYVFGGRVMKVKISPYGELTTTVGANTYLVEEFIRKFERMEATRLKGLQSAATMIAMLGAQKSKPTTSTSSQPPARAALPAPTKQISPPKVAALPAPAKVTPTPSPVVATTTAPPKVVALPPATTTAPAKVVAPPSRPVVPSATAPVVSTVKQLPK